LLIECNETKTNRENTVIGRAGPKKTVSSKGEKNYSTGIQMGAHGHRKRNQREERDNLTKERASHNGFVGRQRVSPLKYRDMKRWQCKNTLISNWDTRKGKSTRDYQRENKKVPGATRKSQRGISMLFMGEKKKSPETNFPLVTQYFILLM